MLAHYDKDPTVLSHHAARCHQHCRRFRQAGGRALPTPAPRQGCSIYAIRPFGCRFWNCQWLANDDVDGLSRPDRAHYVIDVQPDFVRDGDRNVQVIQIWLDKDYPDAHKDPALRAFLLRRAEEGCAALIRLSSTDAFVLAAPPLTHDGQWHEIHGNAHEHQHTLEDKIKALGRFTVTLQAPRLRP